MREKEEKREFYCFEDYFPKDDENNLKFTLISGFKKMKLDEEMKSITEDTKQANNILTSFR